jgi:starch phosphorylase
MAENVYSFTGWKARELAELIRNWLRANRAVTWEEASSDLRYEAVAAVVREMACEAMRATEARWPEGQKRVYYLSMEFLMGRALGNNLLNLHLTGTMSEAVKLLAVDIEELLDREPDAALGNGGLGRLAACFLESMATLGIAGYGYGINYEFGLFKQTFRDGAQHEQPDRWRGAGSQWLIPRLDETVLVPVYGQIEHTVDREGGYNPMWTGWKLLLGVPSDLPVIGFRGETVNALRLFSAAAPDDLDMDSFNAGEYVRAVKDRIESETISKILYPSDAVAAGRELRLVQEYFLVACAVRDFTRRFEKSCTDYTRLPEFAAVQMNDTHPALTVAELMRILVDEKRLSWDAAWNVTTRTLAYTNHTLMPEALERWPVELVEKVVPRHLQIIYEINRRHLDGVAARFPADDARLQRMSIIGEDGGREVRMANLAIVGSHSVNGVAALHSELVKLALVPDFYEMTPEKFNNKTNGVTPRRWLAHANPALAGLLTDALGSDRWLTDMSELRGLERFAGDRSMLESLGRIKRNNKLRLAGIALALTGVPVDPDSLFDIQIKRMHEYKRQLLNVLHIIDRYHAIVEDRWQPDVARTFFFAGKAAPGYYMAKQIIRLIHGVADRVNRDPGVSRWMRVVLLPDYRVSLAERIIPAAELSEQISTAGTEASGTGNMKLMMNGALTIGTFDGANVEIAEEVGPQNIFTFGLSAEDAFSLKGNYRPWELVAGDRDLQRIVTSIANGWFAPSEPRRFEHLANKLTGTHDDYLHLEDYPSYAHAQSAVDAVYLDRPRWQRMSLINIARSGRFSSDRAIAEYARDIWDVPASRVGRDSSLQVSK